jgi:diketogulonate reductase-like aldo/keto reductase
MNRRDFLRAMTAAGAAAMFPGPAFGAAEKTDPSAPLLTKGIQMDELHARPIPSTGEEMPAIGLGTWIVFNVGFDPAAKDQRAAVMDAFFQGGGRMIDSSPMYGSAQEVIGHGYEKLNRPDRMFSADKVWTSDGAEGRDQIAGAREKWNVDRFDLMQVHNLLGWRAHLDTLFAMKQEGKIRYVGITTSHGRRHGEFEQIMRDYPLDFVQFTYNVRDRAAEERLLPLARDRGIAVIVNRPFQRGSLVDFVQRHPLPDWAGEIDCENWPQILLKFIISHPAVTVAIPATSQVVHAKENVGAMRGRLPDAEMRKRIVRHVENL